jgi:hypothetical protein
VSVVAAKLCDNSIEVALELIQNATIAPEVVQKSAIVPNISPPNSDVGIFSRSRIERFYRREFGSHSWSH